MKWPNNNRKQNLIQNTPCARNLFSMILSFWGSKGRSSLFVQQGPLFCFSTLGGCALEKWLQNRFNVWSSLQHPCKTRNYTPQAINAAMSWNGFPCKIGTQRDCVFLSVVLKGFWQALAWFPAQLSVLHEVSSVPLEED